MTYANDCIEMKGRQRRRGLKRITQHSNTELEAAIECATRKFGDDFYVLLHGIDAYMERRKRRNARPRTLALSPLAGLRDDDWADSWGNG